MSKLIPTIYFYLLSAIGMVLLIIGLFNIVHYISGITAYEKYPLNMGSESRCDYLPKIVPIEGSRSAETDRESRDDCLAGLEKEREVKKADDLEKSISFTAIGLLVFVTHFYFARKQRSA